MTPRENARIVLHTVSAETPTGRAARQAAEDVLRLCNVRAAAKLVLDYEYPQPERHPTDRGRVLWALLRRLIQDSS